VEPNNHHAGILHTQPSKTAKGAAPTGTQGAQEENMKRCATRRSMNAKMKGFVALVGYITLIVGGFLLLLFLMNVRSRIYYHGPNYSFLFWLLLYCAITGAGLVRPKRWAAVLLLLPGIFFTALLAYGMVRAQTPGLMPWTLLTFAFVAVILGTPIFILHHWE
jgi:hypothetical protein